MQQIDWSKSPDDATAGGWCGDELCWYKNVSSDKYEVSGDYLMVHWVTVQGEPLCDELIARPVAQPPMSNREYNDASGLSARLTLQRLGYEWKGGELWKPPLGKAPDHIEYDGWNVGDECWISNESGYGLTDYNRELLGFDTMSTIVSLFVTPKGTKMATVSHISGDCVCWKLDMLQRPIVKCDFEHGKDVYVNLENLFVGRFVGVNPLNGDVVTVNDSKFKTYMLIHVHQ